MAWRAETPRPAQPAEMRWNMWDEDSRMDETPVYLHRSLVEAAWRNQTWQKYIINWYIEKALRLARNDKTNKQNSDNDIYVYIYISAIKLRQDFNGLVIHRSIAYVTEYERLRYRHIWGSEDQAQANTSCSAGQARCEPQFYDMKTAMTWSISQQFTMCLRALCHLPKGRKPHEICAHL